MINFCIVPIEFAEAGDYDKIKTGDRLKIDNLLETLRGSDEVEIAEKAGKYTFVGKLNLSKREREILLSAGLLNYTRKQANE